MLSRMNSFGGRVGRSRDITTLKIEVSVDCTDDDLDMIVCAALDGGINHWCRDVKVLRNTRVDLGYQISNGGELGFIDGRSGKMFRLNKELLYSGICRFLTLTSIGMDYMEKHPNGNVVLYLANLDEVIADVIIQYALFGDVIYR